MARAMTRSRHAGGDRVALGIAVILACVTAMVFADAVVKAVAGDATVCQIPVTYKNAGTCQLRCIDALFAVINAHRPSGDR